MLESVDSPSHALPSSRIKDLPVEERPREKLLQRGASALSDAELIALFLGTGFRGRSAVDVAQDLLAQHGGLAGLPQASLKQLVSVKGIGEAKALTLLANLELGRRLAHVRAQRVKLDHPEAIYELLALELQASRVESLRVVLLDTRYQLLAQEEISRGTVNEALAHPREILRPVILAQAFAFVLAHNHPSGDPEPSTADRELTKRVAEAAALMQIKFLDHLIIGRPQQGQEQAWFSFAEAGILG